MPLLEVKDLDKTFVSNGRTVTAIDKLSLSIEEQFYLVWPLVVAATGGAT